MYDMFVLTFVCFVILYDWDFFDFSSRMTIMPDMFYFEGNWDVAAFKKRILSLSTRKSYYMTSCNLFTLRYFFLLLIFRSGLGGKSTPLVILVSSHVTCWINGSLCAGRDREGIEGFEVWPIYASSILTNPLAYYVQCKHYVSIVG